MNYIRDNEIARKIISGEIKELFCIREKYADNYSYQRHIYARSHTFGKKYKVWSDQMGMKNIHTNEFENQYVLRIETDNSNHIILESNSPISYYFETSIKKIRKEKLKKLKGLL
jgi:hypothetical protein